jgi:hypothetical protein
MTEKTNHNFGDSLEVGNLGTYVVSKYCEHEIMTSPSGSKITYSSTPPGGVEDREFKVDAYLNESSAQIKIDMQACSTGNVALEIAEFRFLGGKLQPPKPGALIQEKIYSVDFLIYVIPGHGVAIWKPSSLSELLWRWQAMYGTWDTQYWGNSFYYANAKNYDKGSDWMSLNYFVPVKFIMYSLEDYETDLLWGREPLLYKSHFKGRNIEYLNKRGAIKSFTWADFLSIMQTKEPNEYSSMINVATKYANSFKQEKTKKAMYNAWGQPYNLDTI